MNFFYKTQVLLIHHPEFLFTLHREVIILHQLCRVSHLCFLNLRKHFYTVVCVFLYDTSRSLVLSQGQLLNQLKKCYHLVKMEQTLAR